MNRSRGAVVFDNGRSIAATRLSRSFCDCSHPLRDSKMEHIDPEEPMFHIYADTKHIATMFDPRFEEMFWCSYRLEPVDEFGDVMIHDGETWEKVAFVVKDMDGNVPNPNTFSGGFSDFCERKTDRLLFRSLWPPDPPRRSLGSRVLNAIAKVFRYNIEQQNSTEQSDEPKSRSHRF